MTEWIAPLPSEAVPYGETHLEDHDAIRACLIELRERMETLEAKQTARKPAAKRKATSA